MLNGKAPPSQVYAQTAFVVSYCNASRDAKQSITMQPQGLSFYTSKEITIERQTTYMSNFAKKTEKPQKIHPISLLFQTLSPALPNVLWDYESLHLRPTGAIANKQHTLSLSSDILYSGESRFSCDNVTNH